MADTGTTPPQHAKHWEGCCYPCTQAQAGAFRQPPPGTQRGVEHGQLLDKYMHVQRQE
jgi:hypothetical protein